jgi:hypothetical protein
MIRRIALTSLAVALGCEVKNVGELDTSNVSDTNEPESSSGDESSSSSGDSMTSIDPTRGESSSSGGGEESGSDSTGGCAVSMCGPHEYQDVVFLIDAGKSGAEDLFDVPCTVTDDGGFNRIRLECIESGLPVIHTIDINLSGYGLNNLDEGAEVLFSWVVIAPFWTEDYFTIRSTEGELLLAGGRGSTLTPAAGFFAPIDPAEVVPMCGVEECANECYQRLRTAIEFQTALGGEIVLDGNANVVENESDYFIRVGTSESRLEVMCTDIPDVWHEWVVERITAV